MKKFALFAFHRRISAPVLPLLRTERLVLRVFDPSDAIDVYAYAQSPLVGPMAGWAPHQSIEESRATVQRFIEGGFTWAVVEKHTGHVIGSIDLHPDNKRTLEGARAMGYALGEAYWSQGYATEAATAVLEYAFDTLHCPVVGIYHFPSNLKSRRVIKKLGFTYEGVLRSCAVLPDGTVTDHVCYSQTAEDYAAWKAQCKPAPVK